MSDPQQVSTPSVYEPLRQTLVAYAAAGVPGAAHDLMLVTAVCDGDINLIRTAVEVHRAKQ